MYINSLTVNSINGEIRNISFKKGVNLILDGSTSSDTESGNSVGKTTLLRCVDFCFGSTGEDIYMDKEFKNINTDVYSFLIDNEITFSLSVEFSQRTYVLKRGIKGDVFAINDEVFDKLEDYKKKIETTFLGIQNSKPSLRQLMPKFIRKDPRMMSHTLKFLHQTTSIDQYEILFLFMFGFSSTELLEKRYSISRETKKLSEKLSAIKGSTSLTTSKQRLIIIEREIEKVNERLKNFKVAESYIKEVQKLDFIKGKIAELSREIGQLQLKVALNEQTLKELNSSISKVDKSFIEQIYKQANLFLEKAQIEFEAVLDFHNKMISNKLDFINSGLDKNKSLLKSKKQEVLTLLKEEEELIGSIANTGSLSDLEKLTKELNELHESKGKESSFIEVIESLTTSIKEKKETLAGLNLELNTLMNEFDLNIAKFNLSFSDFSNLLYDEQYILSYEKNNDKIDFKIDNVQGNVGGGKKQAQVAAFDLAYIAFLNEIESQLPKFIMHDSIEPIHNNQIKTLFEIADGLNGQYIVAVLADKISFLEPEFIESNQILSLSQNDKFFKF